MPILEALRLGGISDALVIVTRYFGGVLLGAGGLTRVYSSAASAAIRAAGLVDMLPGALLELRLSYAQYAPLESFISARATITQSDFLEDIRLRLSLEAEAAEPFIEALTARSAGRCQIQRVGEAYLLRPRAKLPTKANRSDPL
jgi:putative IMPACT (imprinted ancient) family translation regulator